MDVVKVLKKIELDKTGHYEDEFYIVDLENSDEAAKVYTLLDKNTINTEYPSFEVNSVNNTNKVVNYFELDLNNISYLLFLISDYLNDKYYLKIGEKK